MSTWVGIDFGPTNFGHRQNYLNTWYFKRSERRKESIEDPDSPICYVYRASRETIARRLELDGYDVNTLEQDFIISINRKVEACRELLSDGLDHDGKNSTLLVAMEGSTLEDWLIRLHLIFFEGLKRAGFEASQDYGDPILNYMLAAYNDFYFEDEFSFAGYRFPCSSEEMYAVVLMEVLPGVPDFVLDATPMIDSGWTDKFEDFIEHHSEHTTFYNTFKESLAKTIGLVQLAPNNAELAKLLYANIITVFEAYLSDTITKQVLKRKALLRRFVQSHKPFMDAKEAKSNVFRTYEGIKDEARKALSATSFHNIVAAQKLYKEVLSTSFPSDLGELIKAVELRHDIVHRNGKTQHSQQISVTMNDVRKVAELADATVLYIDAQIKDGILEADDEE